MPEEAWGFRQFVVKLHSRCNLRCAHCYVYELRDASWRGQPRVMAAATMDLLAARIAEHARTHRMRQVRVVLHGGEPLLAGPARIDRIARTLRAALGDDTDLALSVQTNGTLLTPRLLDVCAEHGIAVGVSLDGDADANDRHRVYAGGLGSHRDVVRGLTLLRTPPYRHLYSGLLCTVDPRQDPVRTYEALVAHEPPRIDLLLPHGTWQFPPTGHDPSGTPYARWLGAVFDRWYDAPRPETGIRLFEEILALLLGGRARTEAVGLTAYDGIVVETDGTLEQTDALKAAYDGAAATGLDLTRHSFDEAGRHPAFAARRLGLGGLSRVCRGCRAVAVCGGGLYAHRYRPENGFDNPSVYCADLYALIHHIRARAAADVRVLAREAR
ncbi:FxsB family cyclophane-forming radical SAM/SPASM peptide maturase [Yinghuangia seranimata]|uniref:FxsB family cyclophane-forming radical SAM/SPASM peptide maturase n=1 Tax=Yinghuangia seranimata TaxID=408067 RepID=UPI00248D24B6|nr:FxsB family cyclophane-forming radical SAM/SPASM peptide maturase [Yinghuangia seranimata]MDI2125320.1 FxsB family radical SAM/SPASM domain protein [Yinghuangia seranimata]